MAVAPEVIKQIINFNPGNRAGIGQRVDLGEINGSIRVTHGPAVYQQRAECLPGQPLVLRWEEQPVLALQIGEEFKLLAYDEDVKSLGEGLAQVLADHLVASKERNTRATIIWPEDY